MKKDGYKIKAGFVGATCMCQVLADNGMADLAYHILLQEGYPGWIIVLILEPLPYGNAGIQFYRMEPLILQE
jgi:hypothetical protein